MAYLTLLPNLDFEELQYFFIVGVVVKVQPCFNNNYLQLQHTHQGSVSSIVLNAH